MIFSSCVTFVNSLYASAEKQPTEAKEASGVNKTTAKLMKGETVKDTAGVEKISQSSITDADVMV
jgi:hypothetical protein